MRKLRNIVSGLMACAMLLASTEAFMPECAMDPVITASAASAYTKGTYAGMTYWNYGEYIVITDCDTSMRTVEIPSEIDGVPVTEISYRAFEDCINLTTVIIPDGVKSIGFEAFDNCRCLTNVSFPESVTRIGAFAFRNTPWLEERQAEDPMVIVNHLLINGSACTGDIVIPEGVTAICDQAFSGASITSVIISDTVTKIGEYAFTFEGLVSVEIPESVAWIGANAFMYTAWLEEKRKEDPLVIVNGILIDGQSCGGDVVVPATVTSVADWAFSDCSGLTSITFSDGLISIGKQSFNCCWNLTDINLPDSVVSIGEYAFHDCDSLVSVVIPDSVTELGDYAFAMCEKLTSVSLSEGMTSVPIGAFSECENLTSVSIPGNIESIEEAAFDLSCNLSDVYYAGSKEMWNTINIVFHNTPLWNATIHFALQPDLILGDANNDGEIGVTDAIALLRYLLHDSVSVPIDAADLNGDGTLNAFDLAILKKRILYIQ